VFSSLPVAFRPPKKFSFEIVHMTLKPFSVRLRHAETMVRFQKDLYFSRTVAPSEKQMSRFFRMEDRARSWFEHTDIAKRPRIQQVMLPYDRWLAQGLDDTSHIDTPLHPSIERVMNAVEDHVRSMTKHEQLGWWWVFVYQHMRTASGLAHIPWPYFTVCPQVVADIVDLHTNRLAYHWTPLQQRETLASVQNALEIRHKLYRDML